VDKYRYIQVVLTHLAGMVIEDIEANLHAAIDRAVDVRDHELE